MPFDPRLRVVRVYLEWDDAERVQGRWLNDGHIVGRFNCGAGDIRAGAPADVGHPAQGALANTFDDTRAVKAAKELEGVTATDSNGLCTFNRPERVSSCVERLNVVAQPTKVRTNSSEVFILGKHANGTKSTRLTEVPRNCLTTVRANSLGFWPVNSEPLLSSRTRLFVINHLNVINSLEQSRWRNMNHGVSPMSNWMGAFSPASRGAVGRTEVELVLHLGYKDQLYYSLKETDWHSRSAHNSAR